jgi:hypothetical protein
MVRAQYFWRRRLHPDFGIVLVPCQLERNAYRYADITLGVIMRVRVHSGCITAFHLWPER